MQVADIETGQNDSTGVEVETVYSKVSGTYAIYRTAGRVVVQFADDEKLSSEQRLALAPLNPYAARSMGSSTDGAKAMILKRRPKPGSSIVASPTH